MSKTLHRIFIGILVMIVITTIFGLIYYGQSYYRTSLEERFFSERHEILKPSGTVGHGYGIVGSAMIIFGVTSYMLRKRIKLFSRVGLLKHWLEFHIFLCILGPLLVLFHTTFKFGGIVAISFWSMLAVVLSGAIGRFIYIQIPRNTDGRELTVAEITSMKKEDAEALSDNSKGQQLVNRLMEEISNRKSQRKKSNILVGIIQRYNDDRALLRSVKRDLRQHNLPSASFRSTVQHLKNQIKLNRRIDLLVSMQNLLKYWHVAHLPFALVMLIIMLIHVGVTLVFGYKWIF